MYCRVIACDFDGTGATNDQPAPELYAALGAARAHGIVTLLVTGRVLEEIQRACGDLAPFDAVVAENGAVIHLCATGRTIQIGKAPPERLLGELRSAGVPFHAGAVVVGTWEQHTARLLDLIRRFGVDGQLIFNRAAVMMLPSGINKAVGMERALEELGRSARNTIAFGDAENDIPMLVEAEVGVAARGAVQAVRALADDALSQPGGAGVALYVRKCIESGGTVATPRRRAVTLGKIAKGAETAVPCSGTNMVISGDPRSGKSWIAGLFAERLIAAGYQLCIIDPEGDHRALGEHPKVVSFGDDLALPTAQAASRLLSTSPFSMILTLGSLTPAEQMNYVVQLLASVQGLRDGTGMPHWLLIDEAHYFFHSQSPCLKYLNSPSGSFCLVTYRPSLLASEVYSTIGAHVLTSTRIEEERYFVTKILQARGPRDLAPHQALGKIEPPAAGLLLANAGGPTWQVFTPAERVTRHAHHARKYADTRLPEDKAFAFLDAERPTVAHNMTEFYQALRLVSAASLRHHLSAGDFSRWVGDVLGDQQLAKALRKLERSTPAGATVDRAEILTHIEDHYLIQETDELKIA